jgi:hypothetical protein
LEAWKSAEIVFRLGNSLTNEPISWLQFMRLRADESAMNLFQQLLDCPAGIFSIKNYQDVILEIDNKDTKIATREFEGTLAIIGSYAFKHYYDALAPNDLPSRMLGKILGSPLGKPIMKNNYAFYIQKLSALIVASKKPYYLIAKNAVGHSSEKTQIDVMRHPLSMMISPSTNWMLTQQATYSANLDSFKLALALKIYKQKHGYYPDKLASLSPEVISQLPFDPFTGKDYIYRKEGKGFILYSAGPCGKDDNGVYDQKQLDKYDDIVWKVLN